MPRILDAAGVIRRLSTHTNVIVTRRAAATFPANGVRVPGATSTVTIAYAVIVPASGNELRRLPEGRQAFETRTVYTAEQVLVGAQAGTNEADLMTVNGASWEVQLASEWDARKGYYASAIQRAATG